VQKGTHVALLMNNSWEHILAFLSIGKLGAISVPINTATRGESLRYYLEQSLSEYVFVDASLLPRLAPILESLPLVRAIVVLGEGAELDTDTIGRIDRYPYEQVLNVSSHVGVARDVRCSDLLLLAYTSGTT